MSVLHPLERLVRALNRLPGIGEKTAMRLSLFILRDTKGVANDLIQSLTSMLEKVRFCRICQNLTEQDLCNICQDPGRDPSMICVVQEPVDLLMIEKTGDYRGRYHVLHGALSPLDGIGPEEIRSQGLLKRVQEGAIREIILATNPNPEGEATALFLKSNLAVSGVKITRLATGMPVGGTLEYSDAQTLAKSLGNRREF